MSTDVTFSMEMMENSARGGTVSRDTNAETKYSFTDVRNRDDRNFSIAKERSSE